METNTSLAFSWGHFLQKEDKEMKPLASIKVHDSTDKQKEHHTFTLCWSLSWSTCVSLSLSLILSVDLTGTELVNPCYAGNHDCDTTAQCIPQEGQAFQCKCATGFTGDGRNCYGNFWLLTLYMGMHVHIQYTTKEVFVDIQCSIVSVFYNPLCLVSTCLSLPYKLTQKHM